MEIKFTELEDEKILRVSLVADEQEKQEIRDGMDERGSIAAFFDLTESYWSNGWGVLTADTILQLSECFIIAKECTTEDDGSMTLYGKAWTNIHNYMIVNEITELLDNGHYDFYLWEDFGKGENFKTLANL